MIGLVIGTIFGMIVIFYGILSIAKEKSLLFGGNSEKYTEDSIQMFGKISGILELIGGVGILVNTFSILDAFPDVIGWIGGAVVWISVALIAAAFLIVPVRK